MVGLLIIYALQEVLLLVVGLLPVESAAMVGDVIPAWNDVLQIAAVFNRAYPIYETAYFCLRVALPITLALASLNSALRIKSWFFGSR